MASGSFRLIILVFLVELLTCCIPANCNKNLHLPCKKNERKALIKFKESLYDRSGRLTSWHGDDCCRWNGVICDNSTGYVVEIDLRNPSSDINGSPDELVGKVSPSLLDLKYLTHLDLSWNNFGGAQIPDFIGSMSKLRYLNLSGAYFGGPIPTNLGKLSELEYLDLSCYNYNNLMAKNGLNWTSGLSSLRYLNLAGVDLSQAASHWLQTLNSLRFLEELYLFECRLVNLPTSLPFVNFTSLSVLDLAYNGFNSTIPEWLFNLSSRLKFLDLSLNKLYGVLPHTLSNSTLLEVLNLSVNLGIEGNLTKKLGNLCNLKALVLNNNKFGGGVTEFIDGLSECSNKNLETLNLQSNQLSGNLPNSIGSLKNLRYLLLANNLFEGSIPKTIGNLSSLREFDLSYNQMNDTIPASFGQLVLLEALHLSGNTWEGIITEAHLANLSRLHELSIGTFPNTSVVFNMSPDWMPSFKLGYVNIQGCKLGPKFPTWLKNQTKLRTIVMKYAMISDVIPDWFLNMALELRELDIAHNQFRGKVPNSLGFLERSNVDLSSNLFDGPLPLWSWNVTTLYLRDNMFSGPIPSNIGIAMPSLIVLDISRNNLNGTIPFSIGYMTKLGNLIISNNRLTGNIPRFLGNLPMLYILDMSNNSLSGSIPEYIGSINFLRFLSLSSNNFSGSIPESIGSISDLSFLSLSNNNLSGSVPESIGSLLSLRFLILSSNNLSGELPSSLRNCSQLLSLGIGDNQFSGEIPIWIGQNLPYLLILSLRNNLFTGNIPQEICRLSFLHVVDASKNKLTGFVPRCIGNLGRFQMEFWTDPYYAGTVFSVDLKWILELGLKGNILGYTWRQLYLVNTLDLSSNDLFGEIPSEIGDLGKLQALNLSMNHFTGRIPLKFGNLKILETLDLSQNQLSGPIPTTLASLTFLNHMNFSYNNLSGMIPTGNQFQALPDPSIYVGNNALCGFPLTVECNRKRDSSVSGENEEEGDGDDRLEKVWFFSFVGLGFMTGFWAVLVTLFLKEEWRIAYFGFVERMVVYLQTKFSRMGRR